MPRPSGTLAVANVTKYHGAQLVLAGVSLVVAPGSRIGLVGPNGVGKTTLLRVLAGLEPPDSGAVRRSPPTLEVGYLPQQPDAGEVSGGEAARAALAKITRSDFDVLLLDEPTNNLDFAGLERLEAFLATSPASVVVVSHDRAFLDRSVTRIVELEEGSHGVREYAGGWSEYERVRKLALARHYDEFERYQDERRRIEEQARRMSAWEERGYGQGRRKKKSKDVKKAFAKKLDRLERVEKPYEPWQLRLGLSTSHRSGDVVLRLEQAIVERGSFRLGPLDLEVRWRDRIALLGPNGSGKTTLLDALLGKLPLSDGDRHVGRGVVLGELEQARTTFTTGALLSEFVRASGLPEEQARTLLAKFGLGPEHIFRSSASLSPGERTRAVLALFSARGINCLVLDEPTNHLDVEAIEELEAAVARFEGTVLLVTHDRRFLESFRATSTLELPARAASSTSAPSGAARSRARG